MCIKLWFYQIEKNPGDRWQQWLAQQCECTECLCVRCLKMIKVGGFMFCVFYCNILKIKRRKSKTVIKTVRIKMESLMSKTNKMELEGLKEGSSCILSC